MNALEKAMAECADDGISFNRVETNGIRMFYARKGKGFPLVLLHGWPEFWMVFRPIINLLADDFDVIVPDLRGCGDTGKAQPGPDDNAGADVHARDIKGLVESLGISKFGLVGGDLGAYVAQAFGHNFPEMLSGLFFFCTPYPGLGKRYAQPDHLTEVWYQYFQQMPWAADLVGQSREACKIYMSHFLNHWSGDNPAVFKDLIEIYTDNFMKNDNIQGGFDWYVSSAKNRRLWVEEKLPMPPVIDVPTHFMWGRRDPLIRPDWSDRLGEYFSNYTIEFAEAGHFVHAEVPTQAAANIRTFFADKADAAA
ncbi:alpha/beta fold hydrolase [Ruegeria arenilitoris]|uniref:alpha/beta fold hydrolase n=1 Tax=Ruegeria arenilitoris TaxID=1173585 RepID=UPI00147AA95A|nr:alpha/beta hydrolase [Ruegeria arenilitoris]